MTDNSMESDLNQGTGGVPSSPASGTGVSQPSAADVEALKRLLGPFIEETAAKVAQSTKDKRFAKQEQRLDDFESRLTQYNELVSGGLTQKQALQFMKLEQLLEKAGGSESAEVQPGVQVGSHAPAASVDEQAILRGLGLSDNDPDVTRILRESADPVERVAAYAGLVTKRQKATAHTANPAQVMPSAGGTSVPDRTIEDVEGDLERIRAIPNFMENPDLRTKFQALHTEHRQLLSKR